MKKKNSLKLIKKGIACTALFTSLVTLCSCSKNVDCEIEGDHVHIYFDEDENLSKYRNSEREFIGSFLRTENYLPVTEEINTIIDNDLYVVKDNLDYLISEMSNYDAKREAYTYGYIYGEYYGYDYGYNYTAGRYDSGYGYKNGWHWGYEWQEISLDEYTTDKVRDITYQFQFYKIDEDGKISSKLFSSLEEVTEEYQYFKLFGFVQKNVSPSYYLEMSKFKSRTE